MSKKYISDIISIEESSSHRRSRSLAYTPDSDESNKDRKYFLIPKAESNTNIASLNSRDENANEYVNKANDNENINSIDDSYMTLHSFKNDNSLQYYDPADKYVSSGNTNTHTHIVKRERDNFSNKDLRESNDNSRKLQMKYLKLKDKLLDKTREADNWRNSYFNLLKDSINFDECIKTLYEENRIHIEYIISLENKLNKLLVTCNNITNNFHNNLYKNMNLNNSNDIVNTTTNFNSNNNSNNNPNINQIFLKNYNEILNDYKRQLEILAEEKESLHTNLSIARHSQLQYAMRIEEMQTRIYTLEQSRIEDIKTIENSRN